MTCILKVMTRAIPRHYPVLWVLMLATVSLYPAPMQKNEKTAVNIHQRGGILKNWILLGPFMMPVNAEPAPVDSPEVVRDSMSAFSNDFLGVLLGENNAVIRNYSAIRVRDKKGKPLFRKAREVVADEDGYVSLDSVLTGIPGEVAYAFCCVESFQKEHLRFYWGVDGDAKIWFNGEAMQNSWNAGDSCIPLSKYFDVACLQGVNTVLVKIAGKKPGARFTTEVWDACDSLRPYYQKVKSLALIVNKNEITSAVDSMQVMLRCNIPVPPHLFTGALRIYKGGNMPDTTTDFVIDKAPVGKAFACGIPERFSRLVCMEAGLRIDKTKIQSDACYLWKGNFRASRDSLRESYTALQHIVDHVVVKDRFTRLLLTGAFAWGLDWFSIMDSLSIAEQIRQLVYVLENAEIIETICRGGIITGNRRIPCYLPSLDREIVDGAGRFDPATWLNYKYPEEYALPANSSDGKLGYRFWLFLPDNWTKKCRKMPLILALHDRDRCGYDIDNLRDFGPMGFASSQDGFPACVITPQSRYPALWHAPIVQKLCDAFITTDRISKHRIYLTGSGMGGFTTWHLAASYPRIFAAIVPLSGGGDPEMACAIRRMPVWAFHGGLDLTVSLEQPQEMVVALKQCHNRKVDLSIYPAHGHALYATVYRDHRLYRWLFRQRN